MRIELQQMTSDICTHGIFMIAGFAVLGFFQLLARASNTADVVLAFCTMSAKWVDDGMRLIFAGVIGTDMYKIIPKLIEFDAAVAARRLDAATRRAAAHSKGPQPSTP